MAMVPVAKNNGVPRHGGSNNDNAFEELVTALTAHLSSQPDPTTIDPTALEALMAAYTSREVEWSRYAHGDAGRNYTRNLVSRSNGRSNVLVLVWTPGRGSLVHDHADAHCVMKVLRGRLRETLYEWPHEEVGKEESPLRVKRMKEYGVDEVTYMSDKLGLHRIENMDGEETAVSLHLYTPPNAEVEGCHVFDVETGRRRHVVQSGWFSEGGVRV